MSRTHINFWLDAALLVAFTVLTTISVVTRFVFPPASLASGWTLWGFTLDDCLAMQFNSLAVLALGILVHVTLHWNWVCGVIFSRRKGAGTKDKSPRLDSGVQTLYGVGTLVVLANLVGVAVAAAALCLQSPAQ